MFSQTVDQIGDLKLNRIKVVQIDTVEENFCGQVVQSIRLTVLARTKVQLSCNYGDPSKNIWDTVTNKLYIAYCSDTGGIIRKAVIDEIRRYVNDKEAWAKRYESGNDFTYLGFTKSFFVNGNIITPFIGSEAEDFGSYQLFYINNRVYKIALVGANGFGALSLFVDQNTNLLRGEDQLGLGKYLKNIDAVKLVLAKE